MSRRSRRNDDAQDHAIAALCVFVVFAFAGSREFRIIVISILAFAILFGAGVLIFRIIRQRRRDREQLIESWVGRSFPLDAEGLDAALPALSPSTPSAPRASSTPSVPRTPSTPSAPRTPSTPSAPRTPTRYSSPPWYLRAPLIRDLTPPSRTGNLIERLHSIDWFQFEQVIAILYRTLGYAVSRRGGANPDGGIDLIIEKDTEQAGIQCKHWKTWKVGVRPVRELLGALTDAGLQKGIFVTLCGYTGDAKQLAERHGIQMLDETSLRQLFDSAQAWCDAEIEAALNDPRKLCPKCERQMVLRTASKGPNVGSHFWGCSGYPRCKFTMPLQKHGSN